MQKLNTIDIFRGLFAFILMVYHYLSWMGYHQSTILNFFSIYGVESFFIISGVVLTYTYRNNSFRIGIYFKKRFLRILPLFYFLVLIDIVYNGFILHGNFDYFIQIIFGDIFLMNMFRPDLTSVVSGWSVMDEMLFYILFPLLIGLKNIYIMLLTILLTFIIFFVFNTFVFNIHRPFEEQNIYYVSALFNLPFFLIGMSIATIKLKYSQFNINGYYLIGLIVIIILFIAYNPKNNYIEYIMDDYRIYSMILVSLLILLATFTNLDENTFFYKVFGFFAKISYSLYLMHFIIFYVLYSLFGIHSIVTIMLVAIFSSYITYILIEKKLTNYLRIYVFK